MPKAKATEANRRFTAEVRFIEAMYRWPSKTFPNAKTGFTG
jgi:hypothetical protein